MGIPEDLRSLVRIYADLAQQMIQDHGHTMSEQETETRLIEPMLEILQWNPRGINVRKGYQVKTEKNNYEADYVLMIDQKPRVLIEVKKVAHNLNSDNVIQLMKYAFYVKADISVLTNGNEWRVYEPYHLRSMIFQFSLEDIGNNLDSLWLLSRNSVGSGLLKEEVNRRYTIDRVNEYIQKNRADWVREIADTSTGLSVYGYIQKNQDDWIKDIVSTSIGLTQDGVSRILDKTALLDELSPTTPDVELAPITDDLKVHDTDERTWWDDRLTGHYASLRPVSDVIKARVMDLGEDIRFDSERTCTSFKRQNGYCFIALIVDKCGIRIGLLLDKHVEHKSLQKETNFGGWQNRVNRSLEVSSVEDIDDQLVRWMRESYDRGCDRVYL